MLSKKMHLIPQVIVDIAENLKNSRVENMRDTYRGRLEAIRDFCDYNLQVEKPKASRK